jgi:hypothetical protein
VLHQLDAIRARAYALRTPTLLSDVYASALLLGRDEALLQRIIPPGCGLRDVTTQYSGLMLVADDEAGVVARVSATLSRSRLICAGKQVATAPGAPARAMRIRLLRRGDTYRIADERPDVD